MDKLQRLMPLRDRTQALLDEINREIAATSPVVYYAAYSGRISNIVAVTTCPEDVNSSKDHLFLIISKEQADRFGDDWEAVSSEIIAQNSEECYFYSKRFQ